MKISEIRDLLSAKVLTGDESQLDMEIRTAAASDLMSLPRFPMGGPYATLKEFTQKVQMAPLVVLEEDPVEPVVTRNNPPLLTLKVDSPDADLGRVNCFVQGDNRCRIEAVDGQPGLYRVQAEKPLSGRRNKYTLTAPLSAGGRRAPAGRQPDRANPDRRWPYRSP